MRHINKVVGLIVTPWSSLIIHAALQRTGGPTYPVQTTFADPSPNPTTMSLDASAVLHPLACPAGCYPKGKIFWSRFIRKLWHKKNRRLWNCWHMACKISDKNLTLILQIFISDGHIIDNFWEKNLCHSGTRTTDLQFSVLAP